MKQRTWRRLPRLFVTMLTISAFTFGGGFVIVSLMKRRLVDELHWLTEEEMLDMAALAQASPGAIAVNAAILVGRRVAGWPGMLVAVLGTLLPPVGIIGAISLIYAEFAGNAWVRAALTGMSCGVAAVISDVVCGLGGKIIRTHDGLSIALMAVAFALTMTLHVNVVFLILGAAAVGGMRLLLDKGKGAHKDAD